MACTCLMVLTRSDRPSSAKYSHCIGTITPWALHRPFSVSRLRLGGQSISDEVVLVARPQPARCAGAGRGAPGQPVRPRRRPARGWRPARRSRPFGLRWRASGIARRSRAARRRRDSVERALVDARSHRGIALRIQVDHQHALPDLAQAGGQIDGGGGLADAALLICDAENSSGRPRSIVNDRAAGALVDARLHPDQAAVRIEARDRQRFHVKQFDSWVASRRSPNPAVCLSSQPNGRREPADVGSVRANCGREPKARDTITSNSARRASPARAARASDADCASPVRRPPVERTRPSCRPHRRTSPSNRGSMTEHHRRQARRRCRHRARCTPALPDARSAADDRKAIDHVLRELASRLAHCSGCSTAFHRCNSST